MDDNDKLNPVRMWREWFVKSERAWSEALTQVMGEEHVSKGMGRYVQEALHAHRMFSESMGQYLANLNLPSRQDLVEVGERLSRVEGALAAVQVELHNLRVRLGDASVTTGGASRPRPKRTRRPPEAV